MAREKAFAVAATGQWTDEEENVRLPAGEIHAWVHGQNQTVCGLPLRRAELNRFPHVAWTDALPESGGSADGVKRVCRRCRAAARHDRGGRPWRRTDPRP